MTRNPSKCREVLVSEGVMRCVCVCVLDFEMVCYLNCVALLKGKNNGVA